jgi:F0F1-type ATP synthase beta subunit
MGEQMLSQNLEMTKSFTPQEGNTRKLVTNWENMSKVGKGCCEKSKE